MAELNPDKRKAASNTIEKEKKTSLQSNDVDENNSQSEQKRSPTKSSLHSSEKVSSSVSENEKLSPHFTLHEMLRSQKATRLNITEQFEPPTEIVENLKFLCNNLLEKVRAENSDVPIFISSGYRCPRVNTEVGGKPNSQHLTGQAADIDFSSKAANKAFFEKIKSSDIEFDQLLNEFDFAWVHISIKKEGQNRRQVLDISK